MKTQRMNFRREDVKMDAKEAMEYLKSMFFPADMSESTLKAIAVNQMAISALEKQVPKKPNKIHEDLDYEGFEVITGNCPNCNADVNQDDNCHCSVCGQILNWSSDKE